MKPSLTSLQGRLLRGLVLILSKDSKDKMMNGQVIVEEIVTSEWRSLTFSGERHRIVLRLPSSARPVDFAVDEVVLGGRIVAVERADWVAAADRTEVMLDLLTIATSSVGSASLA